MRTNQWTIGVAAPLVMLLASPSRADFLSVVVDRLDCSDCMKTYRLYAVFSDPTDKLLFVHGTSEVPVALSATTPLLNFGGGFDGLRAEDFAGAPISGSRDSWVTIGHAEFAGNDTSYSPGFLDNDGVHRVIEGSSFSDDDDGWFDTNPASPAIGGDVLIAQFTFVEGLQFFTFTGNVTWRPGSGPIETDSFDIFYGEAKFLCPWDFDLSESVDFPDLLQLLIDWGPCPECCPADFDDSGDVGIPDLLEMLARWGSCW